MALELTSRSFDHGREIPRRYTSEGWNISPSFEWSDVPAETREFALICEDPDAQGGPFVHWIIYGISGNISELPEGLPREGEIRFPIFARQGLNSHRDVGYTGPNPPFWHGIHRYDFFKAIDNHVIEQTELLGVYEKSVSAKTRGAAGLAIAISAPVVIYAAIKRFRRSA